MTTIPIRHPLPAATDLLEVAGFERSSLVDGPGLRFVLFLQGCNYDCTACHNPSTIGRCTGCGVCVDACPHEALSIIGESLIEYRPEACDRCRACLAVCPIDSDPTVGLLSVDSILGELRPAAPFLSGVTVTGGEPTLQLNGLVALFEAMATDPKLMHLTRLVDTNGTLDRAGWARLGPHLDGAMVDLKAGSETLHREITGHSIGRVKESIAYLRRRDLLAEVRLLVIPGVTDTDGELEEWASFVRRVDPGIPVRLMGFRHAGTRPRARGWPEATADDIHRVRHHLTTLGLTKVG